nr:hypothetical protein GCM10025732_47940 [Glycomyces mayteni]
MNTYRVSASTGIDQEPSVMAIDMPLEKACRFAQERSEKYPLLVYKVTNQATDYVAVTFTSGVGDV